MDTIMLVKQRFQKLVTDGNRLRREQRVVEKRVLAFARKVKTWKTAAYAERTCPEAQIDDDIDEMYTKVANLYIALKGERQRG
jgi:hypothetical protein